jgi:hypothetical protein
MDTFGSAVDHAIKLLAEFLSILFCSCRSYFSQLEAEIANSSKRRKYKNTCFHVLVFIGLTATKLKAGNCPDVYVCANNRAKCLGIRKIS